MLSFLLLALFTTLLFLITDIPYLTSETVSLDGPDRPAFFALSVIMWHSFVTYFLHFALFLLSG